MRARLALALTVAAALALPAAASASSISYEGDTLVFHAAAGETNFVVVAVAGGGSAPGAGARLAVVGSRRIADVLRHGLRVRVPTAGRVVVTVRAGRTLVATGKGRGTVRLRVTAAGRRKLRRARRVTLLLAAGSARARVTLTRR